ncbi:MAG TPA: hypothetical protein VJR46_04630 [Candidatus Dormibacteraeota bacterium]|nr:hypothetical protein [Candidatus Dormibacteraeota bacterium]
MANVRVRDLHADLAARLRRAAAVAAAVVVLAGVTGVAGARAAHAAPAPLPNSRLEFGLSNFNVRWLTGSGVPWGYRFTYLAGGVNTSNPWPNWQDPSLPPGQFAVDYMNASTTAPAAYIPVFTYYELLQSNPSVGSSESDRDFSNLNNASTMAAYYANFKLLMQKAGAYGKQVVVHVEPDFWGYMQQRAAGVGASSITAKVRSSGFAEAAAFTDDLVGFAAALKYLRDTYAPNVVLALHASMWSSSIDIASDTRSNIDARTEADKTAAFVNSVGTWDAVFNDVDDHNAAWWELASCGSPPCVSQWFTHWWDPGNVRFPNFARYLAWVDELHIKTARPQVVWQVPMGNQYFLTMNNTCNHYQDNVAPYFISHASDLFNAGLVAVLFGPGNDCQTTNEDALPDGVTNNGGRPTTDILGGCSACNVNTSVWPDDDGGYLRIFVGQYYSGCKSASLSSDLVSPQQRGAVVTLSAGSSGCASPLYEFWLQSPDGRWSMIQGFGASSTWAWDTRTYPAGNYVVHVWANQAGSWTGSWQAFGELSFTLNPAPPCASASISPGTPIQAAGTAVGLSAASAGCPYPRYAYWVQMLDGKWYLRRPFSSDPSWSWDTTGLYPGTYRIHVWANQAGDSTASWEAWGGATVTLSGCSSATIAPSSLSQETGSTVNLGASSAGCPSPAYEYWVQYPNGSWYLERGFSSVWSWAWETTGLAPGTYTVHVWANQQGAGTASWEAWGGATVTLSGCTSATASPASGSAEVGAQVGFSATSLGCSDPVYEFWLQYPDGSWHLMRGFGAASWTWSTAGWARGTYHLHVWANQRGADTSAWEAYGSATYTLT